MTTFIDSVAGYIFRTYGAEMGEVCVVLPNRRAGLFFNRSVSSLTGEPVWAPRTVAIRQFVETLTGREVSDDLLLLKELYGVYRQVLQTEEPFEKFYPWGTMLLGDFDDVDKYLVDAGDLFRNLKAFRELSGDLSYLTEEQIALVRQFWDHFPAGGQGHAARFLSFWEHLHEIYRRFRTVLTGKGLAYEGMLYREAAEMAGVPEREALFPSPVFFVGFNALTPAEERLFRGMQRLGKAFFFWDYDRAYLGQEGDGALGGHDAGRFIGKYLKAFPPPVDLEIFDNLSDPQKTVEVWSSPNRTTQAWVVRKVLAAWGREGVFERERVAVVLADEQLLLPVLHALPEEAGEVNVTMGYPLKASPVNAFFQQALTLMKNRRHDSRGGLLFYYRDVLALLHNPLVCSRGLPGAGRWEQEIVQKNRIFLHAGEIPGQDVLVRVFSDPGDPARYSQDLLEVLYDLIMPALEEEEAAVNLNLEVFYRLSLLVNRFNDFITAESVSLTPGGYLTLLLHLAGRETVSFYGEPLTGLQVMGVLETRLLDFDRLILLSVNEGDLPATAPAPSYIPYNLRKGFGLPAWEHRDSLFAYYFFRLLQRARNVTLVYHTETENGMTGEKSRYLSHLRYFAGMKTETHNLFFRPGIRQQGALVVEKDPRIMEILTSRYCGDRYLSPSALNTYLSCRLSFYFRYVAGIREPDEMNEDVDQALFGRMIHRTLEILYDPAATHLPAEGDISATLLREMSGKYLEKAVDAALQEVLLGGMPPEETAVMPLHTIIRTMVRNYVRKVLEYDRQLAPLTPLAVEKKICDHLTVSPAGEKLRVRLCGKIDRIDRAGGQVRILDYKTGGGGENRLKFGGIDELFDRDKKHRKKEIFQILVYSVMYDAASSPLPVLYFLRDMFRNTSLQQILTGKGRSWQPYMFDGEERKYFRERLTTLVSEIFDPSVPFDMTEKEEICRYCPYRAICERE